MAEEEIAQTQTTDETNVETGKITATADDNAVSPEENLEATQKPIEEERIEPKEVNVFKKVNSIQFSVLSPKLIKKMASAKVVTPELYDKEGYPVDGGLMDIRLGVIDPGLKCKTCGSKLKECSGHFGYIELARPIIHIKFVSEITNLLRATCKECSRVLLPEKKIEAFRKEYEKALKEGTSNYAQSLIKKLVAKVKTIKACPHCKAKQNSISIEKPTTFMENETRVNPIEIRARLEKIPDEDLFIFGINPAAVRPEWMVLTVMPIPPVTMRPSITLESGERSEDDLTHKLGDIVRINQRLFENINAGAPEIIIEDLWDLLQYHITTYFDNNIAQLPPARHRSGQPLKTLTERIKSKEGRIRHNLAGKRTNFSARTVISPDPMIKLNEVGVPKEVATKLTVAERMNEWNKEYLKRFIKKGPQEYPGANYIVRPDGKKKKITEETKEAALEEVQPGYVIERHLIDGDIALFNRQPSLHRMSMMCHRVKVLPYKTFRLNPAVCHPYNADFDGDEMNLHIPQTEEARAEAEILMEVQTQLISPRYGLSIIGCVQDAISGNYILTTAESLTKEETINLLISAGIEDEVSRLNLKKSTFTGKEVFSVIIPPDFNFTGKARHYDNALSQEENIKMDAYVRIKDGQLIHGIMDRANLGEGSGLLLRNIHKKYGEKVTIDILGKLFRLGITTLLKYGFTTAISDTDLPENAKQEIMKVLIAAEQEVQQLIQDYKNNKLDTLPGKTLKDTLELRILEVLNKKRNETGEIVSNHANQESHTMIMAKSGARGNLLNLAQMAACVGQQAMRGKRIDKGYQNRTLSSFKRGDLGPSARAFISNGFKTGLKPYEFFFAAMTGRDSLMDTALRTPKSGYLYRRLANAMQDLRVEYDGTVRDSSKTIIQFNYGDDSLDVSKSENGKLNIKRIIKTVTG